MMKNLNKWAEDLDGIAMNPTDQHLFANKQWQVLEDFTTQLNMEEKNWKQQKTRMLQNFMEKETANKMKYCMRIESLESALIEMKMNY